jgi:hypothetical protein
MERTTTDAFREGDTPVVHSSRVVLTSQMRIAGRTAGVRALPSSSDPTPQRLPRPPLSLPARREVAICSFLPTWTEHAKTGNGRDLLLTGIGDAPASTIRIPQDDGSMLTVERSWTRTATNWQLDRQITKGAHGYRDEVTYRHESPTGKQLNNAIPAVGCATSQSLGGPPTLATSRNFYAPYSTALYSKLVPASGVLGDEASCGGSADDCFYKRMSVYKADAALVVASTLLVAGCVPPIVFTVGPCLALTTAYILAVANLGFAQAELNHCESQVAAPKGAHTIAMGTRSSMANGAHKLALGDCSSGTGFSSSHCHLDLYEISYDGGETWEYFASFVVCDDVL